MKVCCRILVLNNDQAAHMHHIHELSGQNIADIWYVTFGTVMVLVCIVCVCSEGLWDAETQLLSDG